MVNVHESKLAKAKEQGELFQKAIAEKINFEVWPGWSFQDVFAFEEQKIRSISSCWKWSEILWYNKEDRRTGRGDAGLVSFIKGNWPNSAVPYFKRPWSWNHADQDQGFNYQHSYGHEYVHDPKNNVQHNTELWTCQPTSIHTSMLSNLETLSPTWFAGTKVTLQVKNPSRGFITQMMSCRIEKFSRFGVIKC